jgi:hypothetical protein
MTAVSIYFGLQGLRPPVRMDCIQESNGRGIEAGLTYSRGISHLSKVTAHHTGADDLI